MESRRPFSTSALLPDPIQLAKQRCRLAKASKMHLPVAAIFRSSLLFSENWSKDGIFLCYDAEPCEMQRKPEAAMFRSVETSPCPTPSINMQVRKGGWGEKMVLAALELFSQTEINVKPVNCCVNLGGFVNLAVLPICIYQVIRGAILR